LVAFTTPAGISQHYPLLSVGRDILVYQGYS